MFNAMVGIISMNPVPWALEENFARFEAYVREAVRRRAQLVVGPESLIDGYVCGADPDTTRERMLEVAQPVPDGQYIQRACALSKELGIHLVFGFLERDGDRMYNACAMAGPDGEIVGRYRKVHPTNEFEITPGDALKPFDSPFGKTGFLICNDASVVENFCALSAQQVELIIIPTNGGARTMVDFIIRAVDAASWIIVANTASCGMVSARGAVYLEKRGTECVHVQRIDLWDSPRRAGVGGGSSPGFVGRRPDLYGPIARNTEAVTLFDENGQPTELELKRRRDWLDWLRENGK